MSQFMLGGRVTGRFLDLLSQFTDLSPFLFVGGVTYKANKWPKVSTAI
jgi:hypothetical protein